MKLTIKRTVLVAAVAVGTLGASPAGAQSTQKAPCTPLNDAKVATIKSKKPDASVSVTVGGAAPDHNNPKGEKRGGIILSVPFGGKKKEK
jgi:hypothetical protein